MDVGKGRQQEWNADRSIGKTLSKSDGADCLRASFWPPDAGASAPTLSIVLPAGFTADDLRSLDGRDGSDFGWSTTAVPEPVPTLGSLAPLAGSLSLSQRHLVREQALFGGLKAGAVPGTSLELGKAESAPTGWILWSARPGFVARLPSKLIVRWRTD